LTAETRKFVAEFTPTSHKRSLEIVSLAELELLLEQPDANDKEYIALAGRFCRKRTASDKFAAELSAFQLTRSLGNQVDAVRKFAASFATDTNDVL
jgi:hypothetical protein